VGGNSYLMVSMATTLVQRRIASSTIINWRKK